MALLALQRTHLNESVILDYIDGRAQKRPQIEEHLDTCDECRQLVAELARTSLAGGPWGDEGTPTEPQRAVALPQSGSVLAGRFKITRPLGHGAMGMVYEALDEALGSRVAIKVFWPNLSEDLRVLESIRREANLGRRIHHPNVRRVFDVETSNGFTFLTMELIDGITLEERLARGPMGEADAVRVLEQVCDALTAAHNAGIVHRDLKPGNIAVDNDGRVIVMDFGLARDVNAQASRNQGRGLVGTPAYWSPEQARGEPATPVSDVYSLGLIAYRLLSGHPFSLGEDGRVPARYARVVNRCLEQRPQKRYPSAHDFRRALTEARSSSTHVLVACAFVAAAGVALAMGATAFVRGGSAPRVSSAEANAARVDVERETLAAPSLPGAAPPTNPAALAMPPEAPTLSIDALPAAPPMAQRSRRAAKSALKAEARPASVDTPLAAAPAAAAAPAFTPEDATPKTRPERVRRPIDREDPYTNRP